MLLKQFNETLGQEFHANARNTRLKTDSLIKNSAEREVTKQDMELASQYMNELKGNLDKMVLELNNLKLKHPLALDLREDLNEMYHLMYKMLEIVNNALYLKYQGIELSKERKKEMDNEMASIKQQIQNKMSAVKYSAEELAREANTK
ncbi:Viral A-type inclusion protein [Mannheimia sp. USDA-ARS-USMARC-1261]|nr:Viral A-type inclusion protein [Mannheimia sp. USDA-ARS-USMARC-1261]